MPVHFENYIFYVHECFDCVPHECSAQGGQMRAMDPLEPELQGAVSCRVGAGNQISARANGALKS